MAILLELESATQCAVMISLQVLERVVPFVKIIEHMAEIMQVATEEARKAADRLYSMCKDSRDKVQKWLR